MNKPGSFSVYDLGPDFRAAELNPRTRAAFEAGVHRAVFGGSRLYTMSSRDYQAAEREGFVVAVDKLAAGLLFECLECHTLHRRRKA